jgi:hypothetical protein
MARAFMADVPAARIYGLEPYAPVVTARQTNTYINLIQIEPLPPLSLRNNFASYVVCFSVFTHFNEHFFNSWIRDLHRVLALGGVACLTTLGIRFLAVLDKAIDRKSAGEKLHLWIDLILERMPRGKIAEIRDRITNGELYFLPSDKVARAEFAECFTTDMYIRKQYSNLFDVIAYSNDGELAQDCIVLRKK